MLSVKYLVTIFVIIVVVGVGFSFSSRPGLSAGNNEKPNTNHEFKPLSSIHNTKVYNNPINPIIRQVFLNNSTHIDTPYVKEYTMPRLQCH